MEKEQKITKAELARRKREEKLAAERERIEALCEFEKEYDYCRYICGIDEAGRGPLAGPVVAGAVILPKGSRILYINDSKKLSEARRESLYDEIMEKALAVSVGMASPARIDEINILQATYEAMREAIAGLKSNNAQGEYYLPDTLTIIKNKGLKVDAFALDDPEDITGVNDQEQLAAAAHIIRAREAI